MNSTWGDIVSYRVIFENVTVNNPFYSRIKTVPPQYNNVTLFQLKKFTEYTFQVQASTRKGFGPPSPRVFCRTNAGSWNFNFSVSLPWNVYVPKKINNIPFKLYFILFLFAVPKICAQNISAFNVTTRSVDLTWNPLDSDSVPGALTSYEILYRIDERGFSTELRVVDTKSLHTSFHLEGLEESVAHKISVRATGFYNATQCPMSNNVTTKDDGRYIEMQ